MNKNLLSLASPNSSVEIQQFKTQIGEKAVWFLWLLSEEVSELLITSLLASIFSDRNVHLRDVQLNLC